MLLDYNRIKLEIFQVRSFANFALADFEPSFSYLHLPSSCATIPTPEGQFLA
jgi:hypothetical protein